MLICSCSTNPEPPNSKSQPEGIQDYYEIVVDEQFQLDLTSNITTGYSWKWVNKQSMEIVESIDQEYVSDNNLFKKSGVGGKEIWKFKGVKTGVDSIIMTYCQPWDTDAPVDSTIIKIKVR